VIIPNTGFVKKINELWVEKTFQCHKLVTATLAYTTHRSCHTAKERKELQIARDCNDAAQPSVVHMHVEAFVQRCVSAKIVREQGDEGRPRILAGQPLPSLGLPSSVSSDRRSEAPGAKAEHASKLPARCRERRLPDNPRNRHGNGQLATILPQGIYASLVD